MSTSDEREITIWAHYKSFNGVYFTERYIDFDEISLHEEAWLTKSLRRLAADSLTVRVQVHLAWCLTAAITLLRNDPEAWQICQTQEKNISPKFICNLFQILENLLIKSEHTSESKRQISGKFRNTILRTEFNTNEKICIETVNYKTVLGKFKQSTQNDILNMEDHLRSLDAEPPLGAVPHKNYLDLIEKSANILQLDINKIIDACIADLTISRNNRLKIRQIEGLPVPPDQKEEISGILFKATSSLTHRVVESHAPEIIIAAYRQTINDQPESISKCTTLVFHALTENCRGMGIELYKGYSSRQTLFSPERLTTVELQAIFILLLCRTGWNRDSLVEMDRDGIARNETGFAFVLQGFKTKTDDDTPLIYIEKTESEVISALGLLIWSHDRLRKMGFVNPKDRKLWYSWTSSYSFDRSSTIIQMKPYDFIDRNNLFNFSLKQIRSTVLSIDAYRSKNYESARQRGGHSSLGTTGRYLDHIITRNIASSINLQFQSDLEKKVLFNFNARTKAATESLVRIGDGSMCSNAYDGIYSDKATDETCSAQHCNDDGGCPNRRIVINEESILDIIRTREYFFKNWQRLRSDNQNKFNIQIAPKIAFNDALYKFVKQSRHGHILNRIESAFLCQKDIHDE